MSRFLVQKNDFIWETDSVKIVYSDPKIQAFDSDFSYVKSDMDIFHYYYTVKIYRKKKDDWKLVAKRNIYDFPGILQLRHILEEILNSSTDIDPQTCHYPTADIDIVSLSTASFVYEDFYSLQKEKNKYDCWYNFYIGCAIDLQGDLDSYGVYLTDLKEDTIRTLLNCVNSFIEYSIIQHNESVKKMVQKERANKYLKDGKIYVFENEELDKIIINNLPVELIAVQGNGLYRYKGKIKISDTEIYCKEKKILINNILYIEQDPPEAWLYYDVNEIADNFQSILSYDEKEKFKLLSVDELYLLYRMPIINQTWMCREEHGFQYKNTGNPIKDIADIVKMVIKKIKEHI